MTQVGASLPLSQTFDRQQMCSAKLFICMSDAPDWEGSHGWLDDADLRSDALQLPPLHDSGKRIIAP